MEYNLSCLPEYKVKDSKMSLLPENHSSSLLEYNVAYDTLTYNNSMKKIQEQFSNFVTFLF